MNQLARLLTRHVIVATYRLELEPKGNGYDLTIQGHEISFDGGRALDACTHVKVAGPRILLADDRKISLKSYIELPGRLIG